MITVTWVVGDETHVVTDERGAGDITFTATPQLWAQLTSGSIDPVVAFMQGKLKMAGSQAALYDLLPTIPLPSA